MKFGPLRFNLSGSGVGISTGVRGARVSVGPRGTYVTLSALGFQYREKLDSPRPRRAGAKTPVDVLAQPESHTAGAIETASAATLAASTPDASLQSIQKRLSRPNFTVIAGTMGFLGVGLLAVAQPNWIAVAASLLFIVIMFLVWRWDSEERSAQIVYDVDNEAIVERLALCVAVGEALASANCLWHVSHSVLTHDRKRNAGASSLIQRTQVRCHPGSLKDIEMNIEPWCIDAGPQKLLFLPDRILVREGSRLAGIPYEDLTVRALPTRFIEDGVGAPDAKVVGTTWKYVNKSGGPDRRFNDNRELRIYQYAELDLSSRSGLHVIIQVSSPESAAKAAFVIGRLALQSAVQPAATQGAAWPVAPAPPGIQYFPPPEPGVPEPASLDDDEIALVRAVAAIYRHLAAADRRISDDEVELTTRKLCEILPDKRALAHQFGEALRSLGAIDVAAPIALLRTKHVGLIPSLLNGLHELVAVDGKRTPKEEERLRELEAELRGE